MWEKNKKGKLLYHNSRITELEVNRGHVAVVVGIGRAKRKIENEQVNGHKNRDYELEHNYGQGQQTLSLIFSLESRRELWNALRTILNVILVQSWRPLLLVYLEEEGASP